VFLLAEKLNTGQITTPKPWSYQLAFWGVALLLFLPPFYRGLFFATEQQKALILAVIIFWFVCLWKYTRRNYTFLAHPLDYFVLALPVIYVIAAFNAVNYGLAVDEVVKNVLYFLTYWVIFQLATEEIDISRFLHVIYLAALGVALAGLATATGLVNIKDGFLDGRIYSSFQYPNALASYLAAAGFLGLFFWQKNGQLSLGSTITDKALLKLLPEWLLKLKPYGYLYAAANFFLLAVLFGTKSRGGLLVTGVVFILYLIGLNWQKRLPAIIHVLIIGVLSYLAVDKFISAAIAKQMEMAWLWIFIGLVIALALQAAYNFLLTRKIISWDKERRQTNRILMGLVAAIVVASGVIIAVNPAFLPQVFSFEYLRNAFERFYFVTDALAMLKEKPLLGWGGGGWEEAYRSFQRYLYNSNEVHSYYFQVAVETGILGLLAVIGLWVAFLWTGWRSYRSAAPGGHRQTLIWTMLVAAVAIGAHALIDFDLSLSALTLSLYTLFACTRAAYGLPETVKSHQENPVHSQETKQNKAVKATTPPTGKKQKKKHKKKNLPAANQPQKILPPPNPAWLAVLSVITLLLFFLGVTLASASSYALTAEDALGKQNINQGLTYMKKAAAYNPFSADYHNYLMRLYLNMGRYEQAITEARQAAARSRYNAAKKADLSSAYLSANKYAEAIKYAQAALTAAPYQIVWYENLANVCATAGRNELIAGNKKAAGRYLKEAVKVPELIQTRVKALNDYERKMWRDGPLLAPTPRVDLSTGQANYFLGNWQKAEQDLQAATADEQLKGEAFFWLALVKEKQGKGQEAKALVEKAAAVNKAYSDAFKQFKALPTL
jgi:tetratricopeptide (TPR) repeat protein